MYVSYLMDPSYNLNEEFIQIVKDYEIKCIQSLSNKNETIVIKEQMIKLIDEANLFSIEKQAYLDELKINDAEMKQFNQKSEEIQLKLSNELTKLNNLIFDNKLIKFLSNTNEMNKFEIGIIDFEQLGETTVFLFNF